MRAFIIILAAAAACRSSSPAPAPTVPAPASITLPFATRTVGLRWTHTIDLGYHLVSSHDGAVLENHSRYRTAYEILELGDDGTPRKLAMTFVEHVFEMNGAPILPSARTGKSYVAWLTPAGVDVEYADGGEVPNSERTSFMFGGDGLGTLPPLEEIVARRWTVGEQVELTEHERARLVPTTGPNVRPIAMSLTLRELGDGLAHFAVAMTAVGPGGRVEVSGTLTVDVRTGRHTRFAYAGTFESDLHSGPMTGTISSVVTDEF